MERGVDGRARRELLAREALLDAVECPGVVAEEIGVLLDVRERRLGRLVVPLDRRPLPVADLAVVADLDLDDVHGVRGLPGDDERLGELQRRDPGGHVHGG